ncbi:MAG: hydroxymyristoyl-ACP dehydratase [Pseudomonadota bacterium]|nr:hydroxymyristoyl-ACP dehydratase [Pseudomonadota bacterium]
MLVDKAEIERRIPHAGEMCLLDGVLEWNADVIRCRAISHRDPNNPLRRNGKLYAISGVEYASQAMAIHGALSGTVAGRPRAGYLASLRDVVCHCAWLDDGAEELIVFAERTMGDESRVVYGFSVASGGKEIIAGRATVVLDISDI